MAEFLRSHPLKAVLELAFPILKPANRVNLLLGVQFLAPTPYKRTYLQADINLRNKQ